MNYVSLHNHPLSLNDGWMMPPAKLRGFLESKGMTAFAITDHGTQMAVELIRKDFEDHESPVKLIYGVEFYVFDDFSEKSRHLVVLAMDYQGEKAIMKAQSEAFAEMTDADKRAVITRDLFGKYFGPGSEGYGHCIALSACMQGVISVDFLRNEFIEKEAQKIERRADKIDFDEVRYQELLERQSELEDELNALKEQRANLTTLKNRKFGAREKKLAKLTGEEYETEKASLEADKKETEAAAAEYATVKEKESSTSKMLTSVKAEVRKFADKDEKRAAYFDEANKLRDTKISDEEMYENALNSANYFIDIFGRGNFYAELQYHGIPEEAICFPMVAQVAEELDIPVVATNDAHMIENSLDNRKRRQILRSLRFNKWEEEMVGDSELYLKDGDEVKEALLQILPEDVVDRAIAETVKIADRCNVVFPNEKHYPKFVSDDGMSSVDRLKMLVNKGFKRLGLNGNKAYIERCRYELEVMKKLDVIDYLLIVQDFLAYGRLLGRIDLNDPRYLADPYNIELLKKLGEGNVGMSIGVGRGSAAGSLICYLIGITDIDPMKYDLLFERELRCAI